MTTGFKKLQNLMKCIKAKEGDKTYLPTYSKSQLESLGLDLMEFEEQLRYLAVRSNPSFWDKCFCATIEDVMCTIGTVISFISLLLSDDTSYGYIENLQKQNIARSQGKDMSK